MTRRELLRCLGFGAGALITSCRRGIVVDDLQELADRHPDAATAVARDRTLAPTPQSAPPAAAPDARSLGFATDLQLTPNDAFYTLKFGDLPEPPDLSAYKLEIGGMVKQPLHLTLDEVKALPPHAILRTLECISNPAGGDLIGNAAWKGVRMADLVALAQPDAAAPYVRLDGFDGYHTGISRELALDPESYVVYEMNGEPLPLKHGAPLRCLFPGRYGQKQPKWLGRITWQAERHVGHWERQGWSDEAVIQINSRIDAPVNAATVKAPIVVSGVAFSDLSGVAKVVVAVDDGDAFEASLRRAPSPWPDVVWTEWDWTWTDPVPGNHTLMARATDGNGLSQNRPRTNILAGTKPDGTSEMHRIRLFVA